MEERREQLGRVGRRPFKPRREGGFPATARLPAACWAPCCTPRLQREAGSGLHPPGGPGFPWDPHAQVSGTSAKPLSGTSFSVPRARRGVSPFPSRLGPLHLPDRQAQAGVAACVAPAWPPVLLARAAHACTARRNSPFTVFVCFFFFPLT